MTREDAIKTIRELWRETNDSWYEETYKMAIEALKAESIRCKDCEIKVYTEKLADAFIEDGEELADSVKVVRCKDCDRGFGSPVCPIQSQGWAINKDTFFCAWGERRGEVM